MEKISELLSFIFDRFLGFSPDKYILSPRKLCMTIVSRFTEQRNNECYRVAITISFVTRFYNPQKILLPDDKESFKIMEEEQKGGIMP